MSRFVNSKWFYRLLSLFFALLLFVNANHYLSGNNGSLTIKQGGTEDIYQESLSNVPITLKYNSNKYFVTTSTQAIDVSLTSSNKVLLDTEANKQTRQFSVIADLTDKGPGTYTVPLKVAKLNNAIDAKLAVKKIQVKIEPKESKTFKVQTAINSSQIKKGYQIQSMTVDPTTVVATAGRDTIAQIDKVVAEISSDTKITQDTTEKAVLKAYDSQGDLLNVKFSVQTATVNIKIDSPTKTVPINLLQRGTNPNGIESYQLLCDTQTITLKGPQSKLDDIKSIDAYIDISDIEKTETKKIKLNIPSDLSSDTQTVSVTIVPLKDGEKPLDISNSDDQNS